MKFTLEINLENDAMSSSADLSAALKKVAKRIETSEYIEYRQRKFVNCGESITRGIVDENGNTVGNWEIKE